MTSTTTSGRTGAVRERRPRTTTTPSRARSIPRAGWMVVARKEFGDHLLSSRFVVLLIVLALAAAVPLYFVSGQIRDAPSRRHRLPGALHRAVLARHRRSTTRSRCRRWSGSSRSSGRCSGSRSRSTRSTASGPNGTLPRLLSQPIHRDDVINGKFAAGLAVIALVLVVMVAWRHGVRPDPAGHRPGGRRAAADRAVDARDVRSYVALWLAFGMLLSVGVRRAATSALDRVRHVAAADVLRRADRARWSAASSRRSRPSIGRGCRSRTSASRRCSSDCCRTRCTGRRRWRCSTRR